MKAHVRVGAVEVTWTARDSREVRRMLTTAGGIAAALGEPTEDERPALGFTATTELDPER